MADCWQEHKEYTVGHSDRYDLDRSQRPNMWLKFDYILFIAVMGLAIVGIIMLPGAMSGYSDKVITRTFIVQLGGLAAGIGMAIALSCVDYIVFRHIAIFFYAGNVLLMLLVYTPLGMDLYGSRNWLNLGFTTYQPAELMKLATIVMVAVCLEDMRLDHGRTLYNVGRIGFFFFLPLGLVLLQKDLGTALVFVFFFVIMVFTAKLKLRYFAVAGITAAIAFPFVWKFFLSNDEIRKHRILTFFDSSLDPQGYGFQANMAKRAIGAGQLFGNGIGKGPVSASGMLPVKESDFIFSVICEELGFIGAMLVIFLFMVLLIKMIGVSRKSSDYFGEYLAIGIFAMFFFHFLENIGMNIGIMPITGLPLPFISMGGSALITNMFSIGVILSISARRRSEGLFGEDS